MCPLIMVVFNRLSFIILLAFSVLQTRQLGHATSPAVSDGQEPTCTALRLLNIVPFPDSRDFSGWDRGFELLPAGHLAARHINQDPRILSGYKLEVIDLASEACGISAINDGYLNFFRNLTKERCVFGVVGLYCSTVTNAIAPLSNHPMFGHVTLAASTSPMHRQNSRLTYTFHSIASSSVFNQAILALMNEFNWKRINIGHDLLGVYFISTTNNFVEQLTENSENRIISRLSIQPQRDSISAFLDITNQEEARISYLSTTEDETAALLCEAHKRQFLWPGYVYILYERSLSEILSLSVDCSREEMLQATEGIFLLQYRLFNQQKATIISGITYEEYYKQYVEELEEFERASRTTLEKNLYANSLYDQVWAFALAANASADNLSFFNSSITAKNVEEAVAIRKVLAANLRNVEFNGASGFISFGEQQEVGTLIDINQVQNGTEVLIGRFYPHNRSITIFEELDIPGDTFDFLYHLVPVWVGVIVLSCDAVVIVLVLSIMASIILLRKMPEIRSSSISLSLLMLLGCFVLCISSILETGKVIAAISAPSLYAAICNVEFWCFLNGINVIFVTLSVRLLRTFHVFRSYRTTGKYWSDKYLILYIILTCSVMIILLIVWTGVDPLHHMEERTYVPSASPPHYLLRNHCSSDFLGIWLTLSLCLIGMVVFFVIFLAIQTRHIKRKNFKDTKKVNLFVFCTCFIYAVFIPLWVILSFTGFDTGAYVSNCIAKLSGAALCPVILFLPKVVPILCIKNQA